MKKCWKPWTSLTIRSIQWQNHYAREAGEPEWTDAQIEKESTGPPRPGAMENAPGTTGGQGCGGSGMKYYFLFVLLASIAAGYYLPDDKRGPALGALPSGECRRA